MCEWLLHMEDEMTCGDGQRCLMVGSNLVRKIRTIAAVIWFTKDDISKCDHLQEVITEEKFRCVHARSFIIEKAERSISNHPRVRRKENFIINLRCESQLE